MSRYDALTLVTAVLVVAIAGCGSRGSLHATNVQVGRSLNSDNSVGTITSRFQPDDTIYVAVLTDGPGSGTITARWTFRGQTIKEEQRNVAYNDAASTEFHIHYAGGSPPGAYRVELEIDGAPVGSRDIIVER
jgi:hypothetical protein